MLPKKKTTYLFFFSFFLKKHLQKTNSKTAFEEIIQEVKVVLEKQTFCLCVSVFLTEKEREMKRKKAVAVLFSRFLKTKFAA
jgi:hypothetical protein